MPGTSQPISIRSSTSSHQPSSSHAHAHAHATNPWSTTTADDLMLYSASSGSTAYNLAASLSNSNSNTHGGHGAHNTMGSPGGGMGSSWQNTIHPGPLFVSSSLASSYGASGGMSMSFGSVAGSFGSRLFPGAGPLNPLDPTLKCAMSSSIESDHGSLIRALNGEIEHCQNYSCCGLHLRDLHALVRHFEEAHVVVHGGPMSPTGSNFGPGGNASSAGQGQRDAAILAAMAHHLQQQQAQQQQQQQAHSGQHHLSHRSSDSALAGALGPVSSATFFGDERNSSHAQKQEENEEEESKNLAMTGGVAAFDYDDMEMDVAPDSTAVSSQSHSHSHSHSPSSSMSNHSSPGSRSGSGSPPAGGANAHAHGARGVNGVAYGASASAVSSPPDTPLLATPISPLSSTFNPANANAFPWASQAGDGGATPLANVSSTNSNSTSSTSTANTTPTGPSAFDSFHLPAKSAAYNGLGLGLGGGAAFSSFASPAAAVGMYASSAGGAFARKGVQGGSGHGHGQSLYTALRAGAGAGGNGGAGRMMGMNGYAGYEQFSSELPGALALHPAANGRHGHGHARANGGGSGNGMDMEAIQPELLFGASAYAGGMGGMGGMNGMGRGAQTAPSSEINSPSTSRAASPTSAQGGGGASGKRSKSKDSGVPSGVFDSSPLAGPSTTASSSSSSSSNNPASALQASTTLSRPGASLLLSKPFKCPKPGCMKSYKQANGLKYHMTHGQCNFTPPPELASLQGLSEREAERRLRPYCCQVAPCQRRYKNMNGLRYHYQHSGEHGAVGLRMLAEGRHDAMRCRDVEEEEGVGAGGMGGEDAEGEREREREGAARRRGMKLDTNVSLQQAQTQSQAQGMLDSPMSAFPSVTATSLAAQQHQQHQRQNSSGMGVGVMSPQFEYVSMQSQPASAYASPWTSPRSSPPLTPATAVQAHAQAQVQQMQQYQALQTLQAQAQQQQQQHFDAQQQQQQQWAS